MITWFVIIQYSLEIQKNEVNQKILVASIIIGIISLLSLLTIILVIRSTVKGIKHISQIDEKVSNGDLDIKIDLKNKDEIGLLVVAMRRMVETISEMVSDIQNIGKICVAGKLDSRVNADKYKGEFRNMIIEVNCILYLYIEYNI